MTARPILLNGDMVRAILAGAKTQTRRLVVPNAPRARPVENVVREPQDLCGAALGGAPDVRWWAEPGGWVRCPYGQPGGRLWVRETWRTETSGEVQTLYYRADEPWHEGAGWKPSIHMPRWASRLTLEVTEVRVQRLQEISEEDAKAEGIQRSNDEKWPWRNYGDGPPFVHARSSFASLWDSINGDRASWDGNPWVWAVSFRVVTNG